MRTRLVPLIVLAALAALAVAGCGGGGGGSNSDLAGFAPAGSPLYVEATIQPEAELSENVNALAKKIAGIDDLGGLIVSELESSASDEPVDFAKEVEPWLGEKAGIFFEGYDGSNFTSYGVAVETTDAGAAQELIDKQTKSEAKDGSFDGVDYKVEEDNGQTVGIIDDTLVFAEDEKTFKTAIEASSGESLADQDSFTSTFGEAADGSLADVFVDVGGLIEQSGGAIDEETQLFLETSGIDAENATAVASLVPGSDQVEIDFATNVTGDKPSPGDASQLLGSLPGGSFAAFATSEFGRQLKESIDSIDAQGIPGQLEPHELKQAMKAAGIDLDKITESIGDIGLFAQGNTENNLTGALVLTTNDAKEATNTVSNIGLLLRASGMPGVTAISGKATGFSVRSPGLGRQPLIVAAQGNRIAVSYGVAASAQALNAEGGATLASNPAFKEASESLEGTPISGFVDGPAALALIGNVLSPEEAEGFAEAKPYVEKIAYAAIGAGSSGDLTTAKMIVGLTK
ncbi:MAG: hypothetical protein QOE56_60 [Solirubrobacterales bacterium]|jgi:hypothetical protein|nr:hypothetical protein [Solirubrobacterales bacterium]